MTEITFNRAGQYDALGRWSQEYLNLIDQRDELMAIQKFRNNRGLLGNNCPEGTFLVKPHTKILIVGNTNQLSPDGTYGSCVDIRCLPLRGIPSTSSCITGLCQKTVVAKPFVSCGCPLKKYQQRLKPIARACCENPIVTSVQSHYHKRYYLHQAHHPINPGVGPRVHPNFGKH